MAEVMRFKKYEEKYVMENTKRQMIMQLSEMNTSVVKKATEDIQKGIFEEKWIGRAVSEKNPRDYFEIRLECDEQKKMVEIKQCTMKGCVAVDLQETAMYISDMKKDCMRAFVESTYHISRHISNVIAKNLDLKTFDGQNPFKVYLSYEPEQLQSHEKVLEEMNDISEDIRKSGFKPTEKLVNNVRRFSELEGRRYSLRDLAELQKEKPGFKGAEEKKACFDQIVKECQKQERQQVRFMRQEMQPEQIFAPDIG